MLDKIKWFLISTGLLPLKASHIDKWSANGQVDKLTLAISRGSFKIRAQAVEALGESTDATSVKILMAALDDKVQIVSKAAMKSLQKFGATSEIDSKIRMKLAYWAEQERREQASADKFRTTLNTATRFKHERGSKQTFDNLKEMLKKPMNTGKWM